MTFMRFSIVMPTLGKRMDFLQEAIKSVLDQDFTDFELIVKNGGKKDISSLLPKDPRIKYVHKADTGLGQGLNQGCEAATGEILNESNDDDLMAPGTLRFVDEHIGDAKWLYGQIQYGSEITNRAWDYEALKHGNYVPQPAVFFLRSAYEEVGGFDEVNNFAADYDMWLKLGAEYTPVFVQRVLANYRIHEGQITKTDLSKQLADANTVASKYI
jgi:glycosyltransferase involved in cell wall biosynthesis